MTLEDFQNQIKKLPNSELIESLKLKATDFESGVFELYLAEAKNRNIDVSEIKPDKVLSLGKEIAPIWKRIANYLVDSWVTFGTIFIVFSDPIRNAEVSPVVVVLVGFPIYLLHYLIFEYKFGKSLGKLITGTTVLTLDLEKPSLKIVVKRVISRLIPLNSWFCLFSGISLHERFSNTRCFNDSYLKRLNTRPQLLQTDLLLRLRRKLLLRKRSRTA